MQYHQQQSSLFVPEAKSSILGLKIINWSLAISSIGLIYGGVLFDSAKPEWMKTDAWDIGLLAAGLVLASAPNLLGTKEQEDKFQAILDYEKYASQHAQRSQIDKYYGEQVWGSAKLKNSLVESKVGVIPSGFSEPEQIAAHLITYLGESFDITVNYKGYYKMPRGFAIELKPGKGFGKGHLTKHIDNIQSELGLEVPPKFENGKGCIKCLITTPEFEPLDFDKLTSKPEGKGLFIPVGLDENYELLTVDLNSPLGFSGMIFGMSGSGKTMAVMQVLTGLAKWYQPSEIQFAISDMKGGADYSLFKNSPYLYQNNLATNEEQTINMLERVVEVIDYRNQLFAETGCRNIKDYNEKFPYDKLPNILCLLDEIARLVREDNKTDERDIARSLLLQIATLGRSTGIKLWLAVQKPLVSEIPSVVLGNLPCRIGLMVETDKESLIGIGYTNYCENLLGEGDGYLKYKKKIKRFQSLLVEDEIITKYVQQKRWTESGGDFSSNNYEYVNVTVENPLNTDDTWGGNNWWLQKLGQKLLSPPKPVTESATFSAYEWEKWLKHLYELDCEGKLFERGGIVGDHLEKNGDIQNAPKPLEIGILRELSSDIQNLPLHLRLLIVSSKAKRVSKKDVIYLLFRVKLSGHSSGKLAGDIYKKVLKHYKVS